MLQVFAINFNSGVVSRLFILPFDEFHFKIWLEHN